MKNRLKLFDDTLITYIEHKDKVKIRNIAFRNKKTLSEFSRYLIKLIIRIDELNKIKNKTNSNMDEIDILINSIRRDINKK